MSKNDYCSHIANTLSFHQRNVRFCTTLQLGEILSDYEEKSGKELAQKIISLKENIIKNLDNDIIPKGCENCIYRDSNEISNKIKKLYLFYWYHCNCGCFYCSYRDETKGVFSDKKIEGNHLIYDTIKELYKNNKIDKNMLEVCFGGGEVGVLKEFPKLIELFLKHNVKFIWCDSSGIEYLKCLEKVLKKGKGGITVAVCAGSAETYKKIKSRDKYKQVMKNLKNYVKAAGKFKEDAAWNKENVISKYIILHGFNDNKEEVEKWITESQKIGLTKLEISMEFCWGFQTKAGQKIEDYNFELFDYAEKRCKELGIALRKNETSVALMEKGVY